MFNRLKQILLVFTAFIKVAVTEEIPNLCHGYSSDWCHGWSDGYKVGWNSVAK